MENPETLPPENIDKKPLVSPINKWILFAIGFVGWYLVNGLFWLLFKGQLGFSGLNNDLVLFNLCAWPVNLIGTIILAITRKTRWIGFGLIGALALNLLITLILGIITNGICFVPFFIKGGY